eukprot:snap_masked-scaffold_11-processed-gene-11.13-mRNA-1 protein AED:1.00 eAED:1.00 QI:0/-1/0/0/-1/1/1/0/374
MNEVGRNRWKVRDQGMATRTRKFREPAPRKGLYSEALVERSYRRNSDFWESSNEESIYSETFSTRRLKSKPKKRPMEPPEGFYSMFHTPVNPDEKQGDTNRSVHRLESAEEDQHPVPELPYRAPVRKKREGYYNAREQVSLAEMFEGTITKWKTLTQSVKIDGAKKSLVAFYVTVRSKKTRGPEASQYQTSIYNNSSRKIKKERKKKKVCCCTCTKVRLYLFMVFLLLLGVAIFFIFPRTPDFEADTDGLEFGSVNLRRLEFSIPILLDSEMFIDVELTDVNTRIVLDGGFEVVADLQEPITIESRSVSTAIFDVLIEFALDDAGFSTAAFALACLTNSPFRVEVFNDIDVIYLGIPVNLNDGEPLVIEIDCPL